jgi:hypothetical protein
MARLLTAQDTEQVVEVTEKDLRIDDPDPDTRYTVRLLGETTMREIRRKHTSKRPNRQGQMVETSDEEAIGFDIVDWAIKDWAGIVARNGDGDLEPVPCTRDAKRGLDPYVRSALVEYASHNQRVEAEAQAASFRRPS